MKSSRKKKRVSINNDAFITYRFLSSAFSPLWFIVFLNWIQNRTELNDCCRTGTPSRIILLKMEMNDLRFLKSNKMHSYHLRMHSNVLHKQHSLQLKHWAQRPRVSQLTLNTYLIKDLSFSLEMFFISFMICYNSKWKETYEKGARRLRAWNCSPCVLSYLKIEHNDGNIVYRGIKIPPGNLSVKEINLLRIWNFFIFLLRSGSQVSSLHAATSHFIFFESFGGLIKGNCTMLCYYIFPKTSNE